MMNRIRMQCPHRACILHTLRGTIEHRPQMFQEATVQMKIGRIAHMASRNSDPWSVGGPCHNRMRKGWQPHA